MKIPQSNKELWWLTRIFSGLFVAFALFMFAGYRIFPEGEPKPLTSDAMLELSVAGVGLAGLLLAWKWELVGAILSLAAFIVAGLINPMVFQPTLVYAWPISASLFILLWVRNRNQKQQHDA